MFIGCFVVLSFVLFIYFFHIPTLFRQVGVNKAEETKLSKESTQDYFAYDNKLQLIEKPGVIFGGAKKFIMPIDDNGRRFKGSTIVNDEKANILVRAWRYSYNARGIIEIENYLDGAKTAIIVVHPWGIDDGQGFKVPQPAGFSFQGEPEKNEVYLQHTREILRPFIDRMRDNVALVAYSLPGRDDNIRKAVYNSDTGFNETEAGILRKILRSFNYMGGTIPETLNLRKANPVYDYFENFKGDNSSSYYNGPNYESLPRPLVNTLSFEKGDLIIYDDLGYETLKNQLKKRSVRNVLLAGYNIDVCLKSTTAGYKNLRKDFNVFIVGDATLATFPSQESPAAATTVELSKASVNNFITETSWVSFIK